MLSSPSVEPESNGCGHVIANAKLNDTICIVKLTSGKKVIISLFKPKIFALKWFVARKAISHNSCLVGLNKSRMSTFKALAIFPSWGNDGWPLFEHHREIVFWLTLRYSANHRLVLLWSARIALMRFSAIQVSDWVISIIYLCANLANTIGIITIGWWELHIILHGTSRNDWLNIKEAANSFVTLQIQILGVGC